MSGSPSDTATSEDARKSNASVSYRPAAMPSVVPRFTKEKCPTLGSRVGKRNGGVSGGASIRRTASLDTIYLKGQWPKDSSTNLLVDRCTQTPEDWSVPQFRSPPSTPSGEHLDKFIRQKLVRANKDTGRNTAPTPMAGDHSLTQPIPLPGSGLTRSSPSLVPRLRNSVEGLNQEIERLVFKDYHIGAPTPDGHRAPIGELLSTRSVDTQTPLDNSPPSPTSCFVIPESYRPSSTPDNGTTRDWSTQGKESSYRSTPEFDLRLGTSPHINKFLAREPPDGCERVNLKVFEDSGFATHVPGDVYQPVPLKPLFPVELKPSLGSAFYSLSTTHPS